MLCHSQVTPPPPNPGMSANHCCWQGGPDGGEELWAGHEAALHPKGHCSEEVGELHRQLEQARKESSVAPRDRELVLVRRELGGPSGSWRRRDTWNPGR